MSEDREAEQRALGEMDADIAERVMGWHQSWIAPDEHHLGWFDASNALQKNVECWEPSTEIADAMEVVEKLRELRPKVETDILGASDRWACAFAEHQADEYVILGQASAATLSEAICRAARQAAECLSISDQKADSQAS